MATVTQQQQLQEEETTSIWTSVLFIGFSLAVVGFVIWYFWFRRGLSGVGSVNVTPAAIARGIHQGVDMSVTGDMIKNQLLE